MLSLSNNEDYVKLGSSFRTMQQLHVMHAFFVPIGQASATNDTYSDVEIDENDATQWEKNDEAPSPNNKSKKRKV